MGQNIFKRSIKIVSILLGIWIFIPNQSSATHIVGGNLTYKHLSGDLYQVKLVVRRDCFLGSPEAEFDNPASVGIFTGSGALAVWLGNNGEIKMPFLSSDTLNQFINSDCGFEGTQVCVHETTYLGTVSLPQRPGGYILSYQRCCRNATLQNILDPLETGSTYWIHVSDESLELKNTTPEFKQWPDVYICANKPLVFDHSAIDLEGDSLVYKLCTPSSGATKNNPRPQPPGFPPYNVVDWADPYALNDMLGGIPLKIDRKTGTLTATPNLVGQFLVGICVEEYRNGVLLSVVRRDFQYNVRVCSQPPLAQFTTTETKCDGLTVDFTNTSLSADKYIWDFNYPSGNPAYMSTEKNPTFTYPSIGTYQVRLKVTRGSDGCFDTLVQNVSIFQNKINPDLGIHLTDCTNVGDSLNVTLTDKSTFDEPGYTINQRKWTIIQNGKTIVNTSASPVVKVSSVGDISVKLEVASTNNCQSDITKTIKISDLVPVPDFKIDYAACPVKDTLNIRLVNLSGIQNPLATIGSTKWTLNNRIFSGDSVVVKVPYSASGTDITLETSFGSSCQKIITKKIALAAPPKASFGITGGKECVGKTVQFENNSENTTSYVWTFITPDNTSVINSNVANPLVTFPETGVYKVILKSIRDSDGCFDSIATSVPVFENQIKPDFTLKLASCVTTANDYGIELVDLSKLNEPGHQLNVWKWNIKQGSLDTTLTGKNPRYNISKKENFNISLTVTSSNGCTSTISKSFNVADLQPKVNFRMELAGCASQEEATLQLVNTSKELNSYGSIDSTIWLINGKKYDGDSIQVNIGKESTGFLVAMRTFFGNNCSLDEVKNFDLRDLLPRADYKYKPEACLDGDNIRLSLEFIDTLSRNVPPRLIQWTAGTKNVQNDYAGIKIEVVIPKDSLLYFTLKTRFTNGCTDLIQRSILPGPFASVTFPEEPLVLCAGEKRNLITNPNPAWTYTWAPTSGLDLTDPKNPKVSVTQNTKYYVTVSDGVCTNTDSIDVVALQNGIVLNILTDPFTCDGNVTLKAEGGIGNGVYSWASDATFEKIIGTGQSINTFFIENEKEFFVKFVGSTCSTEPARFKVLNQKPIIFDFSPLTLCREDTFRLNTVNINPSHNNVFNWLPNDHIVSGASTSSPSITVFANEKDSFNLIYTVTNQFNCTLRDTVRVRVGENPVIDFNFQLKECGKYDICFTPSNPNVKGFLLWDFGEPDTNQDQSADKSPCYTYNKDGSYQVRLTNIINSCPFKPVVKQIVVNPQIKLNPIKDTTLCKGNSLTLKATANVAAISYQWTDEKGNTLKTGPDYTAIYEKDTKIVLKAKDIYDCSVVDTINIKVFAFQYSVDTKDSLCVNEASQIKLNITNPADYTIVWSPADIVTAGGNTTTPTITPVPNKVLKLSLLNKSTGCIDSTIIPLKITKPFDYTVKAPEIFCYDVATDVSLTIANPANYTFDWSPKDCIASGGNTPNPKVKITKDKVLTVKVTNKSSGCSQSTNLNVKVSPKIVLEIEADPEFTIFEGKPVTLSILRPLSNGRYNWSNGASGVSITVSPKVTTSYQVTVTDQNGCTASDEVTVTVRTAKCDESDVFVPNAFTPNNDRNNDIFKVRSNFIDEMLLIIYNRWGQEVFKTTNIDDGWDGTFKGEDLAPDAYAYYLKVICVNKVQYVKRGNVTLLR